MDTIDAILYYTFIDNDVMKELTEELKEAFASEFKRITKCNADETDLLVMHAAYTLGSEAERGKINSENPRHGEKYIDCVIKNYQGGN